MRIFWVSVFVLAAMGASANESSGVLEFSVAGMTCAGCARTATDALKNISGVREAKVDFDSKKASVTANRNVGRDEVRQALGALGFEVLFPGEHLVRPLSPEEKEGLDIAVASNGGRVKVKDHLAAGKITIFDYYAEWCGPCHLLTPKLERLVLGHETLALRKVDISDWKSAAAQQATIEFGLPGLPFVRIFDSDGKLLGQVHGNKIDEVLAIVRQRKGGEE